MNDLAPPPVVTPVAELRERRRRLLESLPGDALVLVRGALPDGAMRRFRQSNDFYYLTGLEVPGAYLLLDSRNGETTLYVPHRDERRERTDGPAWAAEDSQTLIEQTGVTRVSGPERLPPDLAHTVIRAPRSVFVPFAPAEGEATTRDSALEAAAWAASDPLARSCAAGGSLADVLRAHFGQLEIHDLSPFLGRLRLTKAPHEVDLLREAGRLCGLGVIEAMRSTEPGVHEFELEAVADFVFRQGGSRRAGYAAIIAGGRNAWHGHYTSNRAALADGDLVLMDYAPDLDYYTSDIGRMWPVNGRFTETQRTLYGFVVSYLRELLARIRPGVTPAEILASTADVMRDAIEQTRFERDSYRAAAQAALTFVGHLSHPVGMAVHDVGDYRDCPLEPGLVVSVDPMIWIPEERWYIRVEDTVVVTDDGIENLTGFVPVDADEVEQLMTEPGLLQYWCQTRDANN